MTFSPAGRRQTRPNFEFAARLGRHPRARTDSDSDRVLTGSESESAERLGMALEVFLKCEMTIIRQDGLERAAFLTGCSDCHTQNRSRRNPSKEGNRLKRGKSP